jgi:hypothetical protein
MFARDALAEETFNGDIVEELGKKIEAVFDEPETVENHCLDDLRMAEMMVTGLGESGIDHVGDAKRVVGTGDNTEMADREDRAVIETVDEGHKKGFSLKVQRSCGH